MAPAESIVSLHDLRAKGVMLRANLPMFDQARRLSRFLVKRQRDGALGVLFSSSSVVVVKMGKAWLCETRDAGIKSGLTCAEPRREGNR